MSLRAKPKTPEERKEAQRKKAQRKREMRKAGKVPTSDLINKLDDMARAYCKSIPQCEARGAFGKACSGRLEWAHLKTREIKYIRHNPLNFMCLCWAHHKFFTGHPDYWEKFCEAQRPGVWDRLNALLIEQNEKMLKPDYEYWIDFYTRNPMRAA